jgi:hypothetical protein
VSEQGCYHIVKEKKLVSGVAPLCPLQGELPSLHKHSVWACTAERETDERRDEWERERGGLWGEEEKRRRGGEEERRATHEIDVARKLAHDAKDFASFFVALQRQE